MLMVVHHHGVVRTHVEGKQRPVPAAQVQTRTGSSLQLHQVPPNTEKHQRFEEKVFSPVSQLAEEEVRRDASSQPGEAAQDRDPRQAGDGDPRPGLRTGPADHQEGHDRRRNEADEEEGGRKGGEEKSEHVCGGLKGEAGPSRFLTGPTCRDLGEVRGPVCVRTSSP